MAQITLRGMDPDIERDVRKTAKASGKSINKVILDIIYQYAGRKKTPFQPPAHSLRELAGGWNQKEADDFNAAIKPCEQIDADMWT